MTETEFRDEIRHALEQLGDAAGPAPVFAEGDGERTHSSTVDGPSRRPLVIVGAAAAVAVLVGGLVAVTTNGTRDESPAVTAASPRSIPAGPPASSTVEASTTTAEATEPGSSTTVEQLTLDEVRAGQAQALRRLPGFTATAEVTQTTTGEPEPMSTRRSRVTLLADGSFWAQVGEDQWGSFEPATGIVRGAFRNPDGSLRYQEIIGQSDNSVPLGVLVGMFPAQLVSAAPGETTITETTFQGRPVWEVTSTNAYDPALCSGDCPPGPDSQTIVDTIDQETGLIIRSTNSTTAANGVTQVATLEDIQVVSEMPADFPGTFPAGANVERSGATAGPESPVAASDLTTRFGVQTPLPPVENDTATATFAERTLEGPVGAQPVLRRGYLTLTEGFVVTLIDYQAVVDPQTGRFQCDDDLDRCVDFGTVPLAEYEERIVLDDGSLAGLPAIVSSGTLRTRFGPIAITIAAATNNDAIELANSLEIVD